MEPGIKLVKLTKGFGNKRAVESVSMEISKGERFVILGPSGCGKTTLLRLIAGLERPEEGEVWIDSKCVSSIDRLVAPYKRSVGMIFQDLALWPHMTIRENVAFGLSSRERGHQEIHNKVTHILSTLGLDGHKDAYPSQCSGGEQQRAAIARALINEPEILLMDEPMANLDLVLREKILSIVLDLHQRLAFTLLYVTHNQEEAAVFCERTAVMNKGHIEQVGSFQEIAENPLNTFVRGFLRLEGRKF